MATVSTLAAAAPCTALLQENCSFLGPVSLWCTGVATGSSSSFSLLATPVALWVGPALSGGPALTRPLLLVHLHEAPTCCLHQHGPLHTALLGEGHSSGQSTKG